MDNYQNLYNQLAEELKQTDFQLEADNIMLLGLSKEIKKQEDILMAKKEKLTEQERNLDIVTNIKQLKKEKFLKCLIATPIALGFLLCLELVLDLLVLPNTIAMYLYGITAFVSPVALLKVYLEDTKQFREVDKRYTRNFLLADVEDRKKAISLKEENIKTLARCISLYEKSIKKLIGKKDYLKTKMSEIEVKRHELLEQLAVKYEPELNQTFASDPEVEVIKLERVKKEDE